MTPHRRIVARAVLLLSLAVGAAATAAPATPASPTPSDPSASSLPEVRLRKLHLVRPDLIPYPVAYDVYC